ncbi:MAG TPA: hypothetical protein VFH51_04050 [Myxococcota bacterium]|nr:hypothetical protein [Myxococcota bacterium]
MSKRPAHPAPAAGVRAERGYSLIIVVAVSTLLLSAGVVTLDAVYADTQAARADDSTQNALYLAEAGAVWGQQTLTTLLYPAGSGPADPPAISSLTSLPRLASGDPICPDGVTCSNWFLLTPSDWITYGAYRGAYRVAASCSPSCTPTATTFTIRAVGKVPSGAKRLLEVTMGP